jgi:hypothetical protein
MGPERAYPNRKTSDGNIDLHTHTRTHTHTHIYVCICITDLAI